jgi:hypothetical protein
MSRAHHRAARSLAVAGLREDDRTVMQMSDQTLGEFIVLTLAGIAMLAGSALLVTDYRGFLTSYARRCWRSYQGAPLRLFYRDYYADEHGVRRSFRKISVAGLVMGAFFLSVELAALVTGHVI